MKTHLKGARFQRFAAARGGQVAIIFALLVPVLVILIAGGLDASFAINARTRLQDASDEAALAASVAAAQNPNLTEAQLQTVAANALAANFTLSSASISEFHVCDPNVNDCTASTGPIPQGSVFLASTAPTTCMFASILPTFCVGGSTQLVSTDSVTTINFGRTLQLNVVMDSSASMIVGATTSDVNTISTWVQNNWNMVKPGDPAPYTGGDNPPCAFACHDEGGSTTTADIAQGLTNAHASGATTRFDVMIAAATQLVNHVQTESTSSTQNTANTYLFNIMSFDTSLHQYADSTGTVTNNLNFAQALYAVGQVSPGLDTYIDNAMTSLATQVGTNGTGSSAASPLKFVMLVTDGLQSDRSNNWNCTQGWQNDPNWNNYNTCYGGYAAPLDPTSCTTMKNNGITVAVLETPYVPLTGQDPNVSPYEKTVRHNIYPGGSTAPSAVSAALQACASTGYYYQANSSTDIATGFTTLTDQFLAQSAVITR